MRVADDKRWVPITHGPTYCSLGCGGGCTKIQYDEAELKARRLAQLCGADFVHRIHENLGWHGTAVSSCGRLYVVEHVYGKKIYYSCFLGEPHSHSGLWTGGGKTPQEAIRGAIEAGRTHLAEVNALLEGL